jgi:peptidyl-tRNA hydrolase
VLREDERLALAAVAEAVIYNTLGTEVGRVRARESGDNGGHA